MILGVLGINVNLGVLGVNINLVELLKSVVTNFN